MSQTIKKQSELKTDGIDNHDDFNAAVLEAQAQISEDPYPFVEVSDRFFKALSKGRELKSLTYGNPGIRVFKAGTIDSVLAEERLPAEKFRELEIKRINEAANK
jgi:hypothetical protein